MAGFAVDGLVSGLDTTALITSLMQAEALPQAALKTKVSTTQTVISAYQSVNARYAALQTSAETLGKAETWTAVGAASSDSSVSVTADATASSGALSFRVTATATGQISVSNAVPLSDPTTFTGYPIQINNAAGVMVGSVTPASGSLTDVVTAINSAAATTGVHAIAVQVAPGSYRLQLSSDKVGSQSAFSVNAGFAASAGIGAPLQAAADATVHIGPAIGGYDVTSNTNTFTGVMPGVTFTVSKKDTDVTISMAKNPNSLADRVQAFVDASNAALTEITRQASFDSTTTSGGPLLSDFAVRQLSSNTISAISQPVVLAGPPAKSVSPVIAGIQTDRNGKITFDRSVFLALQASDPVAAQGAVQGVAERVADVASAATDKTTGTLTQAIQGRNDLVKELGERIADWDDRLTLRQANLQRTFTAMEVAMSKIKSQSSWLGSQLAAMPPTSAS
jgi:flagellar hook-associated protein 2